MLHEHPWRLRWWSLPLLLALVVTIGLAAVGHRAPSVSTSLAAGPRGDFRSSSDQIDPVTVWAVGDGANGSATARGLARRIAAEHPARFLYLGDVYPVGSASAYEHGYMPVYGALKRITSPTPGNHDWPGRAAGYMRYWHSPPPYYAFRIGGWELLSLNSEAPHGPGSPQLRWLRRQLKAPGTCRIAYVHRPRLSAGSHGDQVDITPLWNALQGHARLVLSGHDHNSQRFLEIGTLTQYVAGAGGKSHYGLSYADPRLAFANQTTYAGLRIRLRPHHATLAFVTAAGRVLDRSTASC